MSTAARLRHPADITVPVLLLVGLSAATMLRVVIGGPAPAASIPGGLIFAALLAGLAVASGWRPGRPRPASIVWGAAGAIVLAGGALLRHGGLAATPASPWLLGIWMPSVTLVALCEEALFRGAVFGAIRDTSSDGIALVITTVAFALIHVPLYGVIALPLDLAAGVLLGGLRLHTGGVAAPAMAHVLADLAAPWV